MMKHKTKLIASKETNDGEKECMHASSVPVGINANVPTMRATASMEAISCCLAMLSCRSTDLSLLSASYLRTLPLAELASSISQSYVVAGFGSLLNATRNEPSSASKPCTRAPLYTHTHTTTHTRQHLSQLPEQRVWYVSRVLHKSYRCMHS